MAVLSESLGYKMLINMGWKENTPLGIRGRGILEPVESSFRLEEDISGIGYKVKETEDLVVDTEIKVLAVRKNFGVAISDYGLAFIPKGCVTHITNVSRTCYGRKPLGQRFTVRLVRKEDSKYDWRLVKVFHHTGGLYEKAVNFRWHFSCVQ